MRARPLRVLADANVPFADEAFGRYGPVRRLPGRAITRTDAAEADVLVVRSVTPVGAALLAGTPVRFVGTATAGTDHVDEGWLREAGIAFASAPGSNAESVVEYVLAALLALAAERGEGLRGRTLGVVGAGQVGGRLIPRAEALGLRVLASDPPLAEAAGARGAAAAFVPLSQILAEADVVTLHTPLTRPLAPHPTFHLVGAAELAAMRPGAWLVNAARGAAVDGAALRGALEAGRLGAAVLDVWEGEPAPDVALARRADLATPHVAGYSFDAKVAGTRMVEAALRAWIAAQGEPVPPPWDAEAVLEAEPLVVVAPPAPEALTPAAEARWLDALARQAYDLRADDARFRAAVVDAPPGERAAAFSRLRRDYPRRRAWARFTVQGFVPEALRAAVTGGLGMNDERRTTNDEGRIRS
ncbi:MAG TPA: 4-phosphoerythronate dehydrogenase [Rubricoccaceae bacterium]|nr:4-phosphoerythronate dehydrogenase [Rubricoccaceae bacterium]